MLARAAATAFVEVAVQRGRVDAVEGHRDLAGEEIDVGGGDGLLAARKGNRRIVLGAVG